MSTGADIWSPGKAPTNPTVSVAGSRRGPPAGYGHGRIPAPAGGCGAPDVRGDANPREPGGVGVGIVAGNAPLARELKEQILVLGGVESE